MKICSKCKTEKSLESFTITNSKTGAHHRWCKACVKEYDHNRHKSQTKKIKQQKKARKQEILEWYLKLKSTLKCSWCIESHPACLTFHHTNPAEKETEVAQGVAWGWSKEHILNEIEKCIVLCFNCHSKHHFSEKYQNIL